MMKWIKDGGCIAAPPVIAAATSGTVVGAVRVSQRFQRFVSMGRVLWMIGHINHILVVIKDSMRLLLTVCTLIAFLMNVLAPFSSGCHVM